MDFKNVPKKYRPIPFWSWNEKLTAEETRRQVKLMNDAGIGGYFMHARGGLQTEYMGKEWFQNVAAAIDEGEKTGMRSFAYDENGWPSGFGNGTVNGKGIKFQQKYLRMEDTFTHKDSAIAKCGEHYFYYDVNPFYVDTLCKEATEEFIKNIYAPYYEKYGNRIEGFFTDEPQISRDGIPWSFCLEEEYSARYGEKLLEHLEELFLPVGNYKETRIKFWKTVTDMFSANFMKPIYDWCDQRGLKLTGHLVLEESFSSQLTTNGAIMPHYEYFHIPGMDWLGRDIGDCMIMHQLCSAAAQLGKEAVLAETFALCGHNVSLAELKGIYEWQAVRGVNLLCQHLEGYSLRGIRKRDYPPAMYCQQPWWSVYPQWVDAMSRVSMLIAQTRLEPQVLILHPQTTAWTCFDNTDFCELDRRNREFVDTLNRLEAKHIMFHLGDETLMERHARVENGRLIIGNCSYGAVIKNHCEFLLPGTQRLLEEFIAQGGKIITEEEVCENNVIDLESITYCKRYGKDYVMHYFVNTSPEELTGKITAQGKKLNIYSGELEPFDGVNSFEPWGSLIIIEEGSRNAECKPKAQNKIHLDGDFTVSKSTLNCLTLDFCDYYFDGVLQEKRGYVLNIAERANALGKRVSIHQDYRVNIEALPNIMYLVTESPEQFKIAVNGQEIEKCVVGYFRDKAFKKIDIARYLKRGENVISFDSDFVQSESFYENLKKSFVFESEKNKLSYDMEIEAIYLLGDFGVETKGNWQPLPKNAYRYEGDFVITALPERVALNNLEQQGFPFFCGELELEGELKINSEDTLLSLDFCGVNGIKLTLNEKDYTVVTDNKLDLSGTQAGNYRVKLTLINNLRNLLGPFHLEEGECYCVAPGSFFKEYSVWYPYDEPERWNENYCFVKFGRR